jgi:hypothetical protein
LARNLEMAVESVVCETIHYLQSNINQNINHNYRFSK